MQECNCSNRSTLKKMMQCAIKGSNLCLCIKTFFSEPVSFFPPVAAMLAKYWMTLLVLTVFPAPDSPLKTQIKLCWYIDTTHVTHSTSYGSSQVIDESTKMQIYFNQFDCFNFLLWTESHHIKAGQKNPYWLLFRY